MNSLYFVIFLTFYTLFDFVSTQNSSNVSSTDSSDDSEFVTSLIVDRGGGYLYTGIEDLLLKRDAQRYDTLFMGKRTVPPPEYDWRTSWYRNVVPPAESQYPCQTCWAFASVYMLECQYAIRAGKLESFSKQQLVDCIKPPRPGLGGCMGEGNIEMVIDYVKKASLETKADYGPYLGREGVCHNDPNLVKLSVAGEMYTFSGAQRFMEVLFHRGPIAAMMIWPKSTYNGGIMRVKGPKYCKGVSFINHMVLIVGYGMSNNGIKYWIVKNSYGPDWGIQGGYFKIERGMNTLCIEHLGFTAKIIHNNN